MFGIIVHLRNPNTLHLQVTNRWPDILVQDVLLDTRVHGSIPGAEAAKQPQANTLPPPYFTVGMMFLFWNVVLFFMPHIMGHFPSSTFFSSVHRVFSQVVENIENRIIGFFPLNSKHIHLETTYCIFKIVWWSATVWQTHKKKIGNSFSHHCILYWAFSS